MNYSWQKFLGEEVINALRHKYVLGADEMIREMPKSYLGVWANKCKSGNMLIWQVKFSYD